ncbi:MAG: hypothetical protein KAF91_21560 [Nostoc sp. TH1S01]|nr:hypothetical protein [Nostoc sp. TH1S01]
MRIVDVKTTDGHRVEINPDAISEIIEVKAEEPGFLFFPGQEAEYDVHMVDGVTVRVGQDEHNKLMNDQD